MPPGDLSAPEPDRRVKLKARTVDEMPEQAAERGVAVPEAQASIAAGCTAHVQLHSPGGMTDAIVATIAFAVLAVTPFPLWRRLKALPEWRQLKPVMMAARVIGPSCFILLVVFSNSGPAGLAERILAATLSLWIGALAITLTYNTRHALSSPTSVPGRSTTQQAEQGPAPNAGSSGASRFTTQTVSVPSASRSASATRRPSTPNSADAVSSATVPAAF